MTVNTNGEYGPAERYPGPRPDGKGRAFGPGGLPVWPDPAKIDYRFLPDRPVRMILTPLRAGRTYDLAEVVRRAIRPPWYVRVGRALVRVLDTITGHR